MHEALNLALEILDPPPIGGRSHRTPFSPTSTGCCSNGQTLVDPNPLLPNRAVANLKT